MIPGFVQQMRALGFHIREPTEQKRCRRFFGNYEYTLWRFTINGIGAWVEEKFGPHRIEYGGPIPLEHDPKKLTFFNRRLVAYETSEGDWTRVDKSRHIIFP